ncbi:hypothetical protein PCE1_000872 [Barthelona sp. PCE]
MSAEHHKEIVEELTLQAREAFELFDLNGNGEISANELHLIMKNINSSYTIEDAQELIGTVDLSGTGSATLEEFSEIFLAQAQQIRDSTKSIQRGFHLLDMDKDGYITLDDLKAVGNSINEKFESEALEEVLFECDRSNDGRFISVDDFIIAMRKTR